MALLAVVSSLFAIVHAGTDCVASTNIFGVSVMNNTGGGPFCSTFNNTVWLEYTGTCVGQAQICIQSNNGQCAVGAVFNLVSNSFYSNSSCANVNARSSACEDNDAASSPTCADFGCGTKTSELIIFPTVVGTQTKLVVASDNSTATEQLRVSTICDPFKVIIDVAPLMVTQGGTVLLNITTDDINPVISLYSDANCLGVSLDNNFFDCDAIAQSSYVASGGCTGACAVDFSVAVQPGDYHWFSGPNRTRYPKFKYGSVTVLPNCSNAPSDPCCLFCTTNLANCPGVYSDLPSCQMECRGWLQATVNDTTGNSPQCRSYWSASGNVSDCSNTNPSGGGACIPSCDSFCRVQASECPSLFSDFLNCTQKCGMWPQGLATAMSGDSLSCRWNQLVRKQQALGGVCADVGSLSGACSDPTSQPTTSQPTSFPGTQAPSTQQPSAAPSTQQPSQPTSTYAPTARPSQACPAATLANFFEHCTSDDFYAGGCKSGAAPCTLVCRLYAQNLEKQLLTGVGACPNADCAASCITGANLGHLNLAAMACVNSSLRTAVPMCGFGAVGGSSGLEVSLLGLALGLIVAL